MLTLVTLSFRDVTNTCLFLIRADSSECLSGAQSSHFSGTFQVSVSHEGGACLIPSIEELYVDNFVILMYKKSKYMEIFG